MTNEMARGRGLRARHLAAVTAVVTASFLLSVALPARPTRASDPLADAQAQQQQIQNTLSDQKAQLAALKAQSAALAGRLSSAEAALAAANVEYDRVAGLLHQVRDDVAASQARLADLHAQIADLDAQLVSLAAHIDDQTADLATREALLQDHLRAAYEASQTSLLEIVLASDSFESITNQVSYMLTVSDQDRALADGIREVRSALVENQAGARAGHSLEDHAADADDDVRRAQVTLDVVVVVGAAEEARSDPALGQR